MGAKLSQELLLHPYPKQTQHLFEYLGDFLFVCFSSFGHVIQRADPLENVLMLGMDEGKGETGSS